MFTIDKATTDAAGVFLVGELERLDQTLNLPLVSYKWSRDMPLRSDVSIADEISSFTNTDFAAAGGVNPNGKNWIGKNSTAIPGANLLIERTAQPLELWGMELGWTLPELASAMKAGRPVDAQKYDGMQMKWNMDVDEQVYIGDADKNMPGMLNLPSVTPIAASAAWTATTDPDVIVQDINLVLSAAWVSSGYAMCPRKIGLAPELFGLLASKKVSSAGMRLVRLAAVSTGPAALSKVWPGSCVTIPALRVSLTGWGFKRVMPAATCGIWRRSLPASANVSAPCPITALTSTLRCWVWMKTP